MSELRDGSGPATCTPQIRKLEIRSEHFGAHLPIGPLLRGWHDYACRLHAGQTLPLRAAAPVDCRPRSGTRSGPTPGAAPRPTRTSPQHSPAAPPAPSPPWTSGGRGSRARTGHCHAAARPRRASAGRRRGRKECPAVEWAEVGPRQRGPVGQGTHTRPNAATDRLSHRPEGSAQVRWCTGARLGRPGFRFRGGGSIEPSGRTPPSPKKGSIDRTPKILPSLTPRALEVTQTQKSGKKENGIFGISASRGFRKVIICHIFGGEKNRPVLVLQKIFGAFGARLHND